jgi:uncharacterized protein (TIGR02246 family)
VPNHENSVTLKTLTLTFTIALTAAVAAGCGATHRVKATMSNTAIFNPSEQVQPATAVLRSYFAALNAGDVDAIVPLYAADAVFMAQHMSPAIGHAEIESAYRGIFGMIRLDVELDIDEIVVVSPTVAYARTHSTGTTTFLANDTQVSEGNSELFVLVRDDERGDWRIGRYIFSTTQPR